MLYFPFSKNAKNRYSLCFAHYSCEKQMVSINKYIKVINKKNYGLFFSHNFSIKMAFFVPFTFLKKMVLFFCNYFFWFSV